MLEAEIDRPAKKPIKQSGADLSDLRPPPMADQVRAPPPRRPEVMRFRNENGERNFKMSVRTYVRTTFGTFTTQNSYTYALQNTRHA